VPAGAQTGKIVVRTAGGTAESPSSYTVTVPRITGFSPSSGAPGTVVTISGSLFTGATAVRFNGVDATTFNVGSSSSITATVPAGATTGKITVVAPAGTVVSSSNFTVTVPPTITSFSPGSGRRGSTVNVYGTGFTNLTKVTLGGVTASYSVKSSTWITVKVPTTANTGKIVVTTRTGSVTSATNFTVTLV